jgi:hypothetical protein
LGFSWCESFRNSHFNLPLLHEQNDNKHLYVLFLNETLDFLQYARHSDSHNTRKSSIVCA